MVMTLCFMADEEEPDPRIDYESTGEGEEDDTVKPDYPGPDPDATAGARL